MSIEKPPHIETVSVHLTNITINLPAICTNFQLHVNSGPPTGTLELRIIMATGVTPTIPVNNIKDLSDTTDLVVRDALGECVVLVPAGLASPAEVVLGTW